MRVGEEYAEESAGDERDVASGYLDAVNAAAEIDSAISHLDEHERCLEDIANALYYLQLLKEKQEKLDAEAYADEMYRLRQASYRW